MSASELGKSREAEPRSPTCYSAGRSGAGRWQSIQCGEKSLAEKAVLACGRPARFGGLPKILACDKSVTWNVGRDLGPRPEVSALSHRRRARYQWRNTV
jgi:hypothetical protein